MTKIEVKSAKKNKKISIAIFVGISLIFLAIFVIFVYLTVNSKTKSQEITTTIENLDYEDPSDESQKPPSNPFENHPNYHLFSYYPPGGSVKFRIQHGTETHLNEFPWHVAIFFQNKRNESNVRYGCGGSLIGDNLVLTAAHCLAEDPKYQIHSIRLGEWNLTSNPDYEIKNGALVTTDPIQEFFQGEFTVIIHEFYNNSNGLNDIALIRLKKPAKIEQRNIDKIGLPFHSSSLPTHLVVTGFGRIEDRSLPTRLVQGRIKAITPEQCKKEYKNHKNLQEKDIKPITDRHFCAKGVTDLGLPVQACRGDSGSPLQSLSKLGSKMVWIQYGIVSRGTVGWTKETRCGGDRVPEVIVKVHSYLQWILDHAERV